MRISDWNSDVCSSDLECSIFTTTYSGASATEIEVDYPDDTVMTVRDSSGDKIENLTVSGGSVTLSTAATYARITPSLCKLADSFLVYTRSEELRVGKEWVSTCRFWGLPYP